LWYVEPRRAELRDVELRPAALGEARVRTLYTCLSRGTERLIFEGRVPEGERERMRGPLQEGAFPFPVKYGYCAVGRVEEGLEELVGRAVFALHPHQDVFVAPTAMLGKVPDDVPPRRAVLAANMETALNAVWDSGAGPGDRIAVVGAGIVGLLVAYLCARLPGADVTVIDRAPEREALARRLGAKFATPERAQEARGADVVFHASASSAGLSTALSLGGLEAAVVELSWYGAGEVGAPLGEAFHSRRLRLVSSQVGHVATSRRARWTFSRRLAKALSLLVDPTLDALIEHEVAFEDLPQALPELLSPQAPGLTTVVRYGERA
jgi:threonine dehydrogenase-like Zn-dependent dehydrogenase